jgi:NADPH:quinone reductase
VASGAGDLRPGGRVAWAGVMGAYAEHAVVAADRLVPVPAGVSAKQAAAAMLQGMTAHYLACTTFPLKAGDTCLVQAAAGGVGLLLVQIAKLRDAYVIAAAGTDEKCALALEAGADETINYTVTRDVAAEVRRRTGGRGVHVVYDGVGQATFETGLNALTRRGTMVTYGNASGAVKPFEPLLLNQKGSLFLTRPKLADYTVTREELLLRAGEVLGWVRDGMLKVHVHREYPLAEAAQAHRDLEGRKTTGKVLLVP